jgi:hypothetical protein
MSKPTGIKFVDQVLAIVTGDKAQANAIKNEKLSKAAIKGQVSALEGQIVHDEMAVEKAEENYKTTILLIDSESGNSKEFPSSPTT